MRETIFVWDSVNDCVMSELDGSGAVQVTYTNEPQQYGGVISQRRGTTTSADALGSTCVLTDNSGAVTDTYLNDAWGNSVASTGATLNPFRWVGKYGYYTDNSTGQVYVRARMYQPIVARWRNIDPIPIEVADLNLFRYVRSNPLNSRDPSGLVEPCTVIIIGGIIVIWLCSGCDQPPPLPKCKNGNPEPSVPAIQSPLPPWAARPVECIPKEPNPNLIAQTACNQEGQLVERLCTQGLPRTPKRSCITECLVQKEDYAVAMTKCCASQPCVGNKLLPLQPLCLKALDCFTFQPLGPCLETCLQRPPAYHPDDPVDRDHEIIKRIRTLVKNAQKNCVGLPHPCDVCK
jgi:RHS repeat-associated protein